MRYKKIQSFILTLLAAAACIWCFSSGTAAAAGTQDEGSDFDIKISCGLDGYSKYNTDIPVRLEITNTGMDFHGQVQVVPYTEESNTQGNAYTKDLSVSASETACVEFFIENLNVSPIFRISFLDEEGTVCFEQSMRTTIRYTDDIFTGILSEDGESLNYLDGMPYYIEYYSGYISTRIFPVTLDELTKETCILDIYDMIVINRFDTSELSEEQNETLKTWVNNGGLLVLGTGRDYEKTLSGFWNQWFSGTAGNVESVSADFSLDGFSLLTRSTPMEYVPESSQVLPDETADEAEEESAVEETTVDMAIGASEDTQETTFISETLDQVDPVTLEAVTLDIDQSSFYQEYLCHTLDMGNGAVFIFTFDLADKTFLDWPYNMAALQNIFSSLTKISEQGSFCVQPINDYYIQDMLSNYIDGKLPQIGVFVFIIVIYIALVSPLTYLLLKKKDKRHWIWGLVPLTAFVFTGIVYLLGSSARQQGPYMNYGTILAIGDDGKTSEKTYFSVTSPQNEPFDFSVANQYTIRPVTTYNYQIFSLTNTDAAEEQSYKMEFVLNPEETLVRVLNTSAFNTMYFQADRSTQSEGDVDINITFSDGYYSGSITNRTGYDLENAFLKLDRTIFPVDSLKNGETCSIDAKMAFNVKNYYETPSLISSLDDSPGRRRMLSGYMNGTAQYGAYTVQPDYTFYAFVNGYPVDIAQASGYDVSGNVLLQKKVEINFSKDGIYSVPNILYGCSLLSGELDSLDGYFYSDEISFECYIPSEIQTVLSLELQPQELEAGEVPQLYYLYNWETGSWDPVFEGDDTRMETDELQSYVSGGQLRLMIEKAEKDTYSASVLPVFSMTGREK